LNRAGADCNGFLGFSMREEKLPAEAPRNEIT